MSELTPRQVKLLNGLAVMQISCGRPSAALPLLHLSHQLASEEAHTCYLLANVYHRLGHAEQSAGYFEKYEAGIAKKMSGKALLLKSLIALNKGSISEARFAFKAALKNIARTVTSEKELNT